MKLIIPHSLRKSEFLPNKKTFSLEILKAAAHKALCGVGTIIKSPKKVPKTSLEKLNLTSSQEAGRVLFLVQIEGQNNAILLMLRAKNDKQIGKNMTVKNQKFANSLEKNIDLMIKDLLEKNYDEYPLS